MNLKILLIAAMLMFISPIFAQNPSGDSATQAAASPPSGTVTSVQSQPGTVTTTPAASVTTDSVTLKTSDSTAVKVPATTVTAPSKTTFFGFVIPSWLLNFIISVATMLPGLQLVLKRSPGTAPIGGIVGKVLNLLTAFQDNIVTASPPTSSTTAAVKKS